MPSRCNHIAVTPSDRCGRSVFQAVVAARSEFNSSGDEVIVRDDSDESECGGVRAPVGGRSRRGRRLGDHSTHSHPRTESAIRFAPSAGETSRYGRTRAPQLKKAKSSRRSSRSRGTSTNKHTQYCSSLTIGETLMIAGDDAKRLFSREDFLADDVKRRDADPSLGSPSILARTDDAERLSESRAKLLRMPTPHSPWSRGRGGSWSSHAQSNPFFALNLGLNDSSGRCPGLTTFVRNRWVLRFDA